MLIYRWDFAVLKPFIGVFAQGLGYTIVFALGTIALGVVIGLVFCFLRMSRFAAVRGPIIVVIEVFRCTPVLVQLVWCYYALPALTGIEMTAWFAATLVLSCYAGAFYGEIFRAGILSIGKGQLDAAKAVAFNRFQAMRYVVMPQAAKRMIPPFMNQSILQLKNTSLVSTIAVPDLLYQGMQITSVTYRPLEVYTVVALAYFLVLFPLTRLLQRYEIKRAVA